ncbi:MAG: bifunctional phosphoribosylaminoimidazolecarboxamide formyltransferase/IMP cyclohydrolase [Candidatus Gastranaerophilaceae bacterium]|jgi:phosphoribosylaminoimidazolecarboxamide formyltransferase/IMP cyclohydrolase
MNRILISVYDKTGLVELAQKLTEKYNYEIISTGGTYKFLKENKINVIEISEITGFAEILEGRVKSLHPAIHGGILVKRNDEKNIEEMKNKNIKPIDMVIVNLYPFTEMAKNQQQELSELIEYIDIGGVALLRAGAKNFNDVTTVCCIEDYLKLLNNLEENNGQTSIDFRKELAVKTFQYTSTYDGIISTELASRLLRYSEQVQDDTLPDLLNIKINKIQDLRYGENPHQKAALYNRNDSISFDLLNGKELSFNNITDMSAAYNLVSEFLGVSAVSIIKHNNPCGVAIGENISDAYQKALNCDPISAFGGIIAANEPITSQAAKLMKDIFLEVIIAPDFEPEALEILQQKKNLRLVKVNASLPDYRISQLLDIKELPFGVLAQTADKKELDKDFFKVVTTHKPTESQVEDMIFAWKVAKHMKSNAIVVAKDKKTLGLGSGQTSRIGSMEIALNSACDETTGAVIASDGFFPAVDNIYAAAQARIGAIIQPGGSIKDDEVIAECNKYNIAMITTSIRHFKH